MCTGSERGRAQCWCKTRDDLGLFQSPIVRTSYATCLCVKLHRLRPRSQPTEGRGYSPVVMSPPGTKQTCREGRSKTAYGTKADIGEPLQCTRLGGCGPVFGCLVRKRDAVTHAEGKQDET